MKALVFAVFALLGFVVWKWLLSRRMSGSSCHPPEFFVAVRDHLRSLGRDITVDPSQCVAMDEDGGILGLENLAQAWTSSEPSERPSLIAAHFSALEEARKQALARDAMLSDYTIASGFIATRVLPADYAETVGSRNLVHRNDIEGLVTAATFDFPESVRTFPPERLQEWGVSADEVFQLGIDNVIDRYPLQKESQELAPGCPLHLYATESLFAATHLLRPELFADDLGPHGAFVLAPTRNAILVHPIENSSTIEALPTLIGLAHQLHAQGPGSLSDSLFLLQGGSLRQIRTSVAGRKIQVIDPPPEFVDLLAELTPAEPEP